jgi:predicted DNA-binding antitoxin AbrB/MazE fold protein
MYNKTESEQGLDIVFDCVDINFRGVSKNKFEETARGMSEESETSNIIEFLKNNQKLDFSEGKKILIHIPIGASCEPCIDDILNKLERAKFKDFTVLFSFPEKSVYDKFLSEKKTGMLKANVIYDYANQNKLLSSPNPDFYYIENGKVLLNCKLNPGVSNLLDTFLGIE